MRYRMLLLDPARQVSGEVTHGAVSRCPSISLAIYPLSQTADKGVRIPHRIADFEADAVRIDGGHEFRLLIAFAHEALKLFQIGVKALEVRLCDVQWFCAAMVLEFLAV